MYHHLQLRRRIHHSKIREISGRVTRYCTVRSLMCNLYLTIEEKCDLKEVEMTRKVQRSVCQGQFLVESLYIFAILFFVFNFKSVTYAKLGRIRLKITAYKFYSVSQKHKLSRLDKKYASRVGNKNIVLLFKINENMQQKNKWTHF